MNFSKTIENIRATCDNYVDPNLFAFIIHDDCHMGTNNIPEIEGYGIEDDDTYEERLLKIHEKENVFVALGVMTFMPIINECDLFCETDYNIKLTQEEFDEYGDEEERLFGILIKKGSDEYIIGKTDVCNCSIDASFEKIDKKDNEFCRKIEKIISEKIV